MTCMAAQTTLTTSACFAFRRDEAVTPERCAHELQIVVTPAVLLPTLPSHRVSIESSSLGLVAVVKGFAE